MSIYDSLALRQFSDIDLIVQKKHLLKAVRALRDSSFETVPTPCRPQTVPYMCRPENPKHIALAEEMTLQAPDQTYFVDLHWQLGDRHWRAFSPDVERMWDRAESVNLPQGKVLTFCREDLFLALCYHGNKHRWSHLKWLLDIAQLLRGPVPLDWRRIEAMAKLRPGAGTSAGLALLLADQLLNAPVPSEAARVVPTTERTVAEAATIRNEIFGHGQTSGYDHPTLLALQERRAARMKYRTSRGAKYPGSLFREIFEQVSPGDRALIRLPEKFQFIYHFIRPVRLMVKYAVRSARALWRTNSLHGIR
jgi:hypothetical protein